MSDTKRGNSDEPEGPRKGRTGGKSRRAPQPKTDGGDAPVEAPAPAKKATLPAFGFAADLLAAAKGNGDTEGNDEASIADAGSALDPEDPHRIFDFADRLRSNVDRSAEDVTPARLETWVTFELSGETFALPVEPVREVVRVSDITRVPHAPRPIRGVTNLRGRVIPVIDLRMRIGLPPLEDMDRSARIVSVSSRGRLLGLLVDAVHQVVHIDLNQVQPPPEDVMSVQSDYILGVYHQDEQLILLLDVDRALVVREAGAA
ncbi:MAG: chemotaxis protein CheW [Acidobacteriota bacterium]